MKRSFSISHAGSGIVKEEDSKKEMPDPTSQKEKDSKGETLVSLLGFAFVSYHFFDTYQKRYKVRRAK